jgi:hypothetical protein
MGGGTKEVVEDRAAWEAMFRAGWLAHLDRTGATGFKQSNRPTNTAAPGGRGVDLSRRRLALISAAAGDLPATQAPFDVANLLGDYTIHLKKEAEPLARFRVPPWWSDGDSNPGPPACKAGALPAKLSPRMNEE